MRRKEKPEKVELGGFILRVYGDRMVVSDRAGSWSVRFTQTAPEFVKMSLFIHANDVNGLHAFITAIYHTRLIMHNDATLTWFYREFVHRFDEFAKDEVSVDTDGAGTDTQGGAHDKE